MHSHVCPPYGRITSSNTNPLRINPAFASSATLGSFALLADGILVDGEPRLVCTKRNIAVILGGFPMHRALGRNLAVLAVVLGLGGLISSANAQTWPIRSCQPKNHAACYPQPHAPIQIWQCACGAGRTYGIAGPTDMPGMPVQHLPIPCYTPGWRNAGPNGGYGNGGNGGGYGSPWIRSPRDYFMIDCRHF